LLEEQFQNSNDSLYLLEELRNMSENASPLHFEPVVLYLCLREPIFPRNFDASFLFKLPYTMNENTPVSIVIEMDVTVQFPKIEDDDNYEQITILELDFLEKYKASNYDSISKKDGIAGFPLGLAYSMTIDSSGMIFAKKHVLVNNTEVDGFITPAYQLRNTKENKKTYVKRTFKTILYIHYPMLLRSVKESATRPVSPVVRIEIEEIFEHPETHRMQRSKIEVLEDILPGFGFQAEQIRYGSSVRTAFHIERNWKNAFRAVFDSSRMNVWKGTSKFSLFFKDTLIRQCTTVAVEAELSKHD
jgi:hypothetical protein